MSEPGNSGDFSADDERWLQMLSRTTPSDAPLDEPAQEALLLREALMQEQSQQEDDPVLREHRLQALMFDLRRQGLLQPAASSTAESHARKRPWWRRGAPLGLAAAALLAFFVARPLLGPPPEAGFEEPPAWRSAQPEIVRQAADPLLQAQALRDRLKNAGVWTALYQQGETYVLDLDVEPAQLQALGPLLAAEGLPARPGMARVRFVKR